MRLTFGAGIFSKKPTQMLLPSAGIAYFDLAHCIQQFLVRHSAVVRFGAPEPVAVLQQPEERLKVPEGRVTAGAKVSLETSSPLIHESGQTSKSLQHLRANGRDLSAGSLVL